MSTLSRISASLLTAGCLISYAHANTLKLTPEQIALSINTQIAFMHNEGAFTELSQCSGKSEGKIEAGMRKMLATCLKGEESQFDACFEKGILSVLDISKTKLQACELAAGPDNYDKLETLRDKESQIIEQLDALNNLDELTDADYAKIEALQQEQDELLQQIIALEDEEQDRDRRHLEIINTEMRKINATLEPIKKHEPHSVDLGINAPWRSRVPTFEELPEQLREAKRNQWFACKFMSNSAPIVAETIGAVKRQPKAYAITDEQNQAQMRSIHPANNGTIMDKIDDKVMEISLQHWSVAHTAQGTYDIAKMSWEWCQKLPTMEFAGLEDARF